MSSLKTSLKVKYEGGDRRSRILGKILLKLSSVRLNIIAVFFLFVISYILGDSGYPLEPYLITPYRNPAEGSVRAKFNTVHAKTRNCVERTIGVWKNRHRCLLGARQLHYSPSKAVQIVNACAALHNICVHYRMNDFDVNDETDNVYLGEHEDYEEEESGQHIRDQIMNFIYSIINYS